MKLDEAIRHGLNGQAVLFVGAGFSTLATNLLGKPLPTGPELTNLLLDEIGLVGDYDLTLAAELYSEKKGVTALIGLLRNNFTAQKVAADQGAITEIPWIRIFTTNYDNVVQLCFGKAQKAINTATLRDSPRSYLNRAECCIHFNGYIARMNERAILDEVKLTDTSYLTSSVAESEWAQVFRNDLEIAKSVIFLGYSLYDLDLGRIIYDVQSLRDKAVIITGPSPSPAARLRFAKFGELVTSGVEGFAAEVRRIAPTHVRIEEVPTLLSFSKARVDSTPVTNITDSDVRDLLLRGIAKSSLVAASLREPKLAPYFVRRTEIEKILSKIRSGTRTIVVVSNLGNGKTLLLEGLAVRAITAGANVFWLTGQKATWKAELEYICRQDGEIIIIIENYQRYLEMIEVLHQRRPHNVTMILAARTALNDTYFDRLQDIFGDDGIIEIDIDQLDSNEISEIVRLLNNGGYWGEYAGLSDEAKAREIGLSYRGQWQAVLGFIIQSPEIKNRFKNAFDIAADFRGLSRLIVATLVLSVLNYEANRGLLAELVGTSEITRLKRMSVEEALEFVEFESLSARVRSPLMARYVLKNIVPAEAIVAVLVDLMRVASNYRTVDPLHREMRRELMRFANVESVLPEEGKLGSLVTYYETIKGVEGIKANPFYWLQYAIARLFIRDYQLAGNYFDTAYGLASSYADFDTVQLDNHYARYLLEECMFFKNREASFERYLRAHDLLSQQMQRERKHYPYRVARIYKNFFDAFYDGWTSEQKRRFRASCIEIDRHIDHVNRSIRNNRYIGECKDAMNYILGRTTTII